MVKSSAKDVFMWAVCGALIGGAAGFAVFVIGLRRYDPLGPNWPFSAAFAVFTGTVGGGIGAVAEAVVHARQKRK